MNKELTEILNSGEIQAGKTERLEELLLKEKQVDCPVVHRFGPGVYIREVNLPAGAMIIGHHQNFEHMNIFIKGRVSVINDDGSTAELVAPMAFTGQPGRKIGFIHEDVVWLNIYATEEKDIEKLEAHYLTKNAKWADTIEAKQSLQALRGGVETADYNKVLAEYGVDEELVQKHLADDSDFIELPLGSYKFKKGDSGIHGKGVFATADIEPGELIGPARIDGNRTILGRFTNHSIQPNAVMVQGVDHEIVLIATHPIAGCRGGFDGEEIVIDYRTSLELVLKLKES